MYFIYFNINTIQFQNFTGNDRTRNIIVSYFVGEILGGMFS